MKTRTSLFILIVSFSLIVSCSSFLESDNFMPDSRIDFFTGSSSQVFETYTDSLFPVSFSIDSLNRKKDLLNVAVTYGGGEGGCPPHLFVVQWDEQIQDTPENHPLVKIGLAHFIPTAVNCDALVRETIKVDLADLLNDQLKDSLNINVVNLNDSTSVELKP